VHSVVDRVFYVTNNMRSLVFDAKGLWAITNMNRRILARMGKFALPPGVAPMEVATPLHFVATTSLRFGFDYYYHVKDKLEQKVDDNALEKLDRVAVKELDDVDADIVAELFDDEEGDTDADTAAVTIDDAKTLDIEIPDSVDMDTFQQIAFQLDDAVDSDFEAGGVDEMMPDLGATLEECSKLSQQFGESAGFDMQALYPEGVNDMDNLQSVSANSRRNVGLRQRQNQQTNAAKAPDFTKEMKAKWIEIWSSSTNPSDGNIAFSKWYERAGTEYKVWKTTQLVDAEQKGEPAPPLFDVDQNTVKEWVGRMKTINEGPLAQGAFNESSARLGENFDSFISGTNAEDNVTPFEEDGGIGVATGRDDLELAIPVQTASVFPPPKTEAVLSLLPKRVKRKGKVIDEELLARRIAAKRNLEEAKIEIDEKVSGKKRCNVCDKYYTFVFKEAQHLRNKKFCPVAHLSRTPARET